MNMVAKNNKHKENLIVKSLRIKKERYGIIKLDPEIEYELKLKAGDIIEICSEKGHHRTVGILGINENNNLGTNFIYIDWFLRRNLLIYVDDLVSIRRIEPLKAEKIILMGLDKPTILKNPNQLTLTLEKMVVSREDILSFKHRNCPIHFIIIDFQPEADAVIIQKNTQIICKN